MKNHVENLHMAWKVALNWALCSKRMYICGIDPSGFGEDSVGGCG
jgi:hypothetical protein